MGAPWQFIEAVQATNGTNASIATSTLTKTGGANGVWDAEAMSTTSIAGECFVEWRVAGTTSQYAIGLATADTTNDYSDLNYAFLVLSTGVLEVRELGVSKFTGTHADGNALRIERTGTTIRYYKNGDLLYTSATTSSAPLFVASSFFSSGAQAADVRAYNHDTGAWPTISWTVAGITASAGAAHSIRRLTIAAPTIAKPGDQLVAILASQGAEFVSTANVTWSFVTTFYSTTNRRAFSVYRRIATDDDPASYTFDLNVTQNTIGALFVYRGLDNAAAAVGASATDVSAATVFPCPSRTLTRYADLYIGIVFQTPAVGNIAEPSDAAERTVFSQTLGSPLPTALIQVFDFAAEAIGATDTKRSVGSSASGAVASIALQGKIVPSVAGLAVGALGPVGLPQGGL